MATKRAKKQPTQKQPIPSGYHTIRQTIRILQSYHFKISYDGLSYYRKLWIIGEPIRFKGYMDKFYYFPELWRYITTAKLLTNLLDVKLEYLARYVTSIPKETYLDLPRMLIKVHNKIWGLEQNKSVGRSATIYDTLCIGMKKVLKKVMRKFDPAKPEQFIALLESETQNYKNTRPTASLLSDPYA